MRVPALYASGVLAAALILSACSSGSGTQAVPGGSQLAAPTVHQGHLGHIMPIGSQKLRKNAADSDGPCTGSNPALFYCYYMYPGTSFSQEFGELDGGGNPIPGTWHWKSPLLAKNYSNGRANHQIAGYPNTVPAGWSPYVGDYSTNTISVSSSVPPSNGAVLYYYNVSVCSQNSPNGPGYCDEYAPGIPWQIGIVVLSPSGS